MSKIQQSRDELNNHLRENLGFLEASCSAFDKGSLAEAKRLATTIRVLLHDTAASKSLLGLLGLKEGLRYVDTAEPHDPRNLLAHHGLVGLRFGPQGSSYWAPLGDGPPSRYNHAPSKFEDWWNKLIIVDKAGGNFTRKDLVLALANKDGGAHVAPELDPAYAALTRGNSIGWQVSDGVNSRPLTDVELHSVRQIAFELVQTLRNAGITPA